MKTVMADTPPCVTDTFGRDCFTLPILRQYATEKVHEALTATIRDGRPLASDIADQIANAMKKWAMEKGATHFTHWFQPLTGATAEKHDAFLAPDPNGGVMACFTGRDLIQGEPDASSFPSGGLRATFEARGFTAWDPTSPAFVVNAGTPLAVLCIPCVFYGRNGETLDGKVPLLRSQAALEKQLRRVAALFEITGEVRPHATLGVEQEYFLVDRALYDARPDLVLCGRTLYGRIPARHQQMEDHYFGRVPPRVLAYMADVDAALWRLGVPVKTRHNEVSPAQFEIAPVYEEQNLAVDHNLLTMQVLRDTAERHGFVCLPHEKPFAGVNGSGKHNNWSLVGPDGRNWLSPGATPHENAKFLFVLTAVLKAVDERAALLRASISSAANDRRLGGNEAPPVVMSVYLGEQLDDIIAQIAAGGQLACRDGGQIETGIPALPLLPRDASDRNRTSPFAFTGDKFEFRAVGSGQSCAWPNTVLNLAVASTLDDLCAALEARLPAQRQPRDGNGHTAAFHSALQDVLREAIKHHGRVVFGGDGYSPEWMEEAKRRGLPNLSDTPAALKALIDPATIRLFEKYGVLTERELHSRHTVHHEVWHRTILMEGNCALDLARTFLLPSILAWEERLAAAAETAERLGRVNPTRRRLYERVAELTEKFQQAIDALETALADPESSRCIIVALDEVRTVADSLEAITPDRVWPFPCYGELFFR